MSSSYPRRSSYTPGSYLPYSSSSLYSSPSSSYLSVPSYKSRQRSSSYSNIYTPSPFLYQNASTSRSNSNTQLSDSPSRRLTHSSSRSSLLDSKYSKSPLTYSSSSSQLNSARCNESPSVKSSTGERTNNSSNTSQSGGSSTCGRTGGGSLSGSTVSGSGGGGSSSSGRYSRDSQGPDIQVTRQSSWRASRDYSQLFEDAKEELQSLTQEFAKKEEQWTKEKQSLEDKINHMEETARSLPDLESENKKLKDEHETLLRVLNKLNKDRPSHCVH